MLTMFLKIKPPTFVGFVIEDTFEFIVNYYERLHKKCIMEQRGVEFVTFQLQGCKALVEEHIWSVSHQLYFH